MSDNIDNEELRREIAELRRILELWWKGLAAFCCDSNASLHWFDDALSATGKYNETLKGERDA